MRLTVPALYCAIFLTCSPVLALNSTQEHKEHSDRQHDNGPPHVETLHGLTVTDPLRWMEDAQSTERAKWAVAQTNAAEDFLQAPYLQSMERRIYELSNFDLRYGGRLRGDRLFFLKRPEGGKPVELRVKEGENSRLLLRSDQVPDTSMEQTFIGGRNFGTPIWPDRSGSLIVYGYNDGASRTAKLRIVDAATGMHLPDVVTDVGNGLMSLAWNSAGTGFYYYRSRQVAVANGTGTRTQNMGLYFHRLNTSQSQDTAVIEQQEGDRFIYSATVSTRGDRLVVNKTEGSAQENTYLIFDTKNLASPPLELFARAPGRYRFLGDHGSRLFFQTNYNAPNGRIVYVDLFTPNRLTELVKEAPEPMLAGSNVGGDILGYADGKFFVGYLVDGVPVVRVFNRNGSYDTTLNVGEGKTIWGGIQTTPGQPHVTFSLLSALAPSEIVRFDTQKGELSPEFEPAVTTRASDFIIDRVVYTSHDGTKVPMYIARHKKAKLDGTNPALLYGYGMHKWVSFLFYQPHIVHWMELGGVYAMPALRGGGEYGDKWHQAGIKTNRHNAEQDFVYAGKWLIENGYTNKNKLAANGSSASGPLAANIALKNGDIFAASTIDYPVADMVRASLYGNGALMTEEYGSLDNPVEAEAIIKGSPYQLAQVSGCHLPTLIMVGAQDRTVLPFHGFKLAAAMRQSQTCDHPVLFREMPNTGHNYGSSPEQIAKNTAFQLAFLRQIFNF